MKIEDLNLYALKYFFDTVEAQSLTVAAEKNFVTRSAISQALVRLEGWAGFQLLTHQKKSFQLTEQGEAFYRKMKASYSNFAAAVTDQQVHDDHLKVGCSASLLESYLIPALGRMKPIKDLHLVTGTSKRLLGDLEERVLHLALYLADDVHKTENARVLHKGSFVLAASHRGSADQIITTEDRPEVQALKAHLLKKKSPASLLVVESWSAAAKLANELGASCLVPDFLLQNGLKKMEMKGFTFPYKIILRHLNREFLSEAELRLIEALDG